MLVVELAGVKVTVPVLAELLTVRLPVPVMGLSTVKLTPDAASISPPLAPIVMPLLLTKENVALPSKVPPLITVGTTAPKLTSAPTDRVPEFMVTPPAKVLTPERVAVPNPFLVSVVEVWFVPYPANMALTEIGLLTVLLKT